MSPEDEALKTVIRAYRIVYPHSKPHVSTGFFEADNKNPETFTALITDAASTATGPFMQGEGPSILAAIQHLHKLLGNRLLDNQVKHAKAMEAQRERDLAHQANLMTAVAQLDPSLVPTPATEGTAPSPAP